MAIVNYIREHTRFIEYASDEKLSSGERLLWYALMHIFNQRAQGSVWPDDFIRISNERLLSLCPMKFDTMAEARNRLKQRGLIDYMNGEKNKRSPAYRMVYFCPVYSENSDNSGGNMGYNSGGNMGYNSGGNTGYNSGAFLPKQDGDGYTQTNPFGENGDDEEEGLRACADAVDSAWREFYGKPPTPAVKNQLSTRGALQFGFEPDVIRAAIRLAAVKNAESPVDYIDELFRNWSVYHVHTSDDLSRYLFLRDGAAGKRASVRPDEAREELEKMRRAEIC
jgi:hypothetical protein